MATTTERGYGATHQRERERWTPVVAGGDATCAETYCYHETRRIEPGSAWELAHDHEANGVAYKGPAHRLCNRKELQIRLGYIDPPLSQAPMRRWPT